MFLQVCYFGVDICCRYRLDIVLKFRPKETKTAACFYFEIFLILIVCSRCPPSYFS